MAFQTYDKATNTQTTYKGETADSGVAKVETINPNFQPTPEPTPAAAPVTTNPAAASSTSNPTTDTSGNITLPGGQIISPKDPNYAAYQAQQKKPTMEEVNAPGYPKTPAMIEAEKVNKVVASGAPMDVETAKAYALGRGETNWQKYLNGVEGKLNPLYIGSKSWSDLQKKYTPYQLQQATVQTKDGIYWNQNVNIGEIPRVAPAVQINADTKKLTDIVTGAKDTADKTTTDAAKKKETVIADTAAENKDTLMTMIQDQYGGNAEEIYKKLYDTPEMKTAQEDVSKYKNLNDKYDQQIEDLQDDIRKEVEGEASESYITALASVRGDKILKLKRANQRDLDAATSNLTSLKENAANLLQVRVKDADTRYNQLFQTLQLQIQQEGTAFNQEVALANIKMSLPENRTITIGGNTLKGLKENDNLNVVQFTDASGKTYVIGVDKTNGKQIYKQYIGTAKVGGSGTVTTPVQELANYNATNELARTKDINAKMASGEIGIDYDEKGNSFYYNKKSFDADNTAATTGWSAFLKPNPKKLDYRI